jgi:hypothetical protein
MNLIRKSPLSSIGYGFVEKQYIPKGKNEYYLRDVQNRSGIKYRKLTAYEAEVLVRNGNTSDNWDKVQVSDSFNPALVKRCSFFGLVRIGKLEACYLEFNNLRMPVGLYNSTIISCDIGDNVVIDNVNFMSHYIIGNDVILVNINELATTDHSKFGNGIIREGEKEAVRIWLEVCNENGGRSILPFNGMLPGDAFLWSRYRDNKVLQEQFRNFTEKKFDKQRGYYGKVGDRTVIKNTRIIKDTWIGSDAYIKGANKLKNLTINSTAEASSQIGEGCELVNGIVGYGCRIFYGVKAVRFILADHSQLKYGARLINSYLGENSTISCCEVLNSLIFPAHEQHHNNSFLCAATIFGQSNMAAGATIGSNHNSRGADGELVAGRGFWPGLCVSLKHNSSFACYTLLAKGDFPAELNIPIPFSLVSNDVSRDRLVIMPGYWFLYNMYALARNAGKYVSRDKRNDKTQLLEYDYLAPDSVEEMFRALEIFGKLLDGKKHRNDKEFTVEGFEHSKRKVVLLKVPQADKLFREMIVYYGVTQLLEWARLHPGIRNWKQWTAQLPVNPERKAWKNIGGQLIPANAVQSLIRKIQKDTCSSWDEVHDFYAQQSKLYAKEKMQHAYASLLEVLGLKPSGLTRKKMQELLEQAISTGTWMVEGMRASRQKDYDNPFRKMVYDSVAEMEAVTGKPGENSFIREQEALLKAYCEQVSAFSAMIGGK